MVGLLGFIVNQQREKEQTRQNTAANEFKNQLNIATTTFKGDFGKQEQYMKGQLETNEIFKDPRNKNIRKLTEGFIFSVETKKGQKEAAMNQAIKVMDKLEGFRNRTIGKDPSHEASQVSIDKTEETRDKDDVSLIFQDQGEEIEAKEQKERQQLINEAAILETMYHNLDPTQSRIIMEEVRKTLGIQTDDDKAKAAAETRRQISADEGKANKNALKGLIALGKITDKTINDPEASDEDIEDAKNRQLFAIFAQEQQVCAYQESTQCKDFKIQVDQQFQGYRYQVNDSKGFLKIGAGLRKIFHGAKVEVMGKFLDDTFGEDAEITKSFREKFGDKEKLSKSDQNQLMIGMKLEAATDSTLSQKERDKSFKLIDDMLKKNGLTTLEEKVKFAEENNLFSTDPQKKKEQMQAMSGQTSLLKPESVTKEEQDIKAFEKEGFFKDRESAFKEKGRIQTQIEKLEDPRSTTEDLVIVMKGLNLADTKANRVKAIKRLKRRLKATQSFLDKAALTPQQQRERDRKFVGKPAVIKGEPVKVGAKSKDPRTGKPRYIAVKNNKGEIVWELIDK